MKLQTIIFLGLLSCSTKQDDKTTRVESVEPSKNEIQDNYCKDYDVSEFLKTYEDYGTDGVFDTMFHRIQFHFETIKRSEGDRCTYIITGYDRLKGLVTPFDGQIRISQIIKNVGDLYDPEIPKDNRLIEFMGSFIFREDKAVRGSGIFKGDIYFSLTLNKDNELVDDMGEYMGDGFSNFIYKGTWTSYTTGQTKKCVWGQGRLPDTGDFDIGDGDTYVNEKYQRNGWQRNSDWELIDNPKQWWRM